MRRALHRRGLRYLVDVAPPGTNRRQRVDVLTSAGWLVVRVWEHEDQEDIADHGLVLVSAVPRTTSPRAPRPAARLPVRPPPA